MYGIEAVDRNASACSSDVKYAHVKTGTDTGSYSGPCVANPRGSHMFNERERERESVRERVSE